MRNRCSAYESPRLASLDELFSQKLKYQCLKEIRPISFNTAVQTLPDKTIGFVRRYWLTLEARVISALERELAMVSNELITDYFPEGDHISQTETN